MASVEKTSHEAAEGWIWHNTRAASIDNSNPDIDRSRSPTNYSLTPGLNIPREEQYARRKEIAMYEIERYNNLKEQFYCLNRKDVKSLVSVVVTCPKEIAEKQDPELEERFFKGVADFLTERYGNAVGIDVHKDEGKHYSLPDGSKEFHIGRAHLHYTFIPTVKINHNKLTKMKNPVKSMFNYTEKISAKERINRQDLLTLHPDMNRYLNEKCGIKCNLNSGITKEQGGNRTVAELKREFDENIVRELTLENKQLNMELKHERDINKTLEKENSTLKKEVVELSKQIEQAHKHDVNQGWGKDWNRIEEDKIWSRN